MEVRENGRCTVRSHKTSLIAVGQNRKDGGYEERQAVLRKPGNAVTGGFGAKVMQQRSLMPL